MNCRVARRVGQIVHPDLLGITDPHPDSHANRLRVSLAIADANMELPWDLLQDRLSV